MRFIQLTSSRNNNKKIYINVETIGHVYEEKETGQYSGEEKDRVITYVGCLTHNNGGFKVLESVNEVLTLIYDDKLGI